MLLVTRCLAFKTLQNGAEGVGGLRKQSKHMIYPKSKSRRKFQKSGLESLFRITTAIKVGDKSVSPLHLRGGVRLLIRLIYFPFPRIIAFAFHFVTLLDIS